MARTAPKTPSYRCSDCGWTSVKWAGRCGECQAWGTVDEIGATRTRGTTAAKAGTPALPIGSVDLTAAEATATGISEFDRVLGGGLVPGAVILLAGEPGVGKSTLLLDVASRWAEAGNLTLYVTGEESTAQVRMRAERIGALAEGLYLAAETDLGSVLGHVESLAPSLLVLDSVQTIASAEIEGAAGGVTQVREVAACVIAAAKSRGMTAIIVGHVTKDGSVAGPRALEHLVDVVLYFEGDRHSTLRLVRAVKNRFGPADEIGCFELVDDGIIGLADPSGLFLGDRNESAPGTCVTVTVEGRRPLVTEVQALIAPSSSPQPRRVTSGLDSARIAMMLGVLERRSGLKLASSDCFVATVGGVRLLEPATDLAIALAIASSVNDIALPSGLIAIGEVGLSGDVRKVTALTRRLAEAARLGFTDAIIPRGAKNESITPDIRGHEVASLSEALAVARKLASHSKG